MSNDKLAATFYPQDAPTPQDAPHVGLVGAPVLDRPACQTYPTAKGGAVCGEPATRVVMATRCRRCNPDGEWYEINVCAPCWQLAGEGFIRHHPCEHATRRDLVWHDVTP